MFTSYEELMAAVAERRKELLTLEVDLGNKYNPEHEKAKQDLAEAKAMKSIVGQPFLGDGNELAVLEARVASTRPEPQPIWIQYEKLDLDEWADLMKKNMAGPVDQYERVLGQVFAGLYGQDPVQPDDWEETHPDEEWVKPEPLTMNPLSVSSKGGAASILPGGALNSVIQNFMAWQNSGGEVSIRPTKSGRD